MTRDETKVIIRTICAAYPNYHPADLSETIEIWAAMLTDYDYKQVAAALRKYILSNSTGFAPSIGELTTRIGEAESNYMEPLAAWALVYKAIKNGNYGAEEEYNKLPPEIQEAIGDPANIHEMAMMDTQTVNSVEQSQFIKAYNTVISRRKIDNALPPSLRIYAKEPERLEEKDG